MCNWVVFDIDSNLIIGHNNAMTAIKSSVSKGKYKDSNFCLPNGCIKQSDCKNKVMVCIPEHSIRKVNFKNKKYTRLTAKEIMNTLFPNEEANNE